MVVRRSTRTVNYLKCMVCGGVANSLCQSCQRPTCGEHKYRHPDCQEGR